METINHFPASWPNPNGRGKPALWLHHTELRWVRYSYWQMRRAGMHPLQARWTVIRLLNMGRYSKNALDLQRERRERDHRNSVMKDAF